MLATNKIHISEIIKCYMFLKNFYNNLIRADIKNISDDLNVIEARDQTVATVPCYELQKCVQARRMGAPHGI